MACGARRLPDVDLDGCSRCDELLPVFLERRKVGIPTKSRTSE